MERISADFFLHGATDSWKSGQENKGCSGEGKSHGHATKIARPWKKNPKAAEFSFHGAENSETRYCNVPISLPPEKTVRRTRNRLRLRVPSHRRKTKKKSAKIRVPSPAPQGKEKSQQRGIKHIE
ncbi:MAG: hypothetical protein J6B92_09085 [Paraprevotella sp.]|nr:hypothetical protein [Paraprevotella sp.]